MSGDHTTDPRRQAACVRCECACGRASCANASGRDKRWHWSKGAQIAAKCTSTLVGSRQDEVWHNSSTETAERTASTNSDPLRPLRPLGTLGHTWACLVTL